MPDDNKKEFVVVLNGDEAALLAWWGSLIMSERAINPNAIPLATRLKMAETANRILEMFDDETLDIREDNVKITLSKGRFDIVVRGLFND